MATQPLVTVVIPNYNSAQYLTQAVDSVLSQTYPRWQLIVVDDGSTDDSLEVIARYRNALTLLSCAHTGLPGIVRNEGLRRADGDYIAFLDADDVWFKDKLARQVEYLSAHPDIGLIHSNLQVVDAHANFMYDMFPTADGAHGVADTTEQSAFTQLIHGGVGIWTSSVMLRRSCLDAVGMFDETLPTTEDWHLWLRVARHFRFAFLPEPLVKHRKHGRNTGLSALPKDSIPALEMWHKIITLYPDLLRTHAAVMRHKLLAHRVLAAIKYFRQHEYYRAMELLLYAVRTHPVLTACELLSLAHAVIARPPSRAPLSRRHPAHRAATNDAAPTDRSRPAQGSA